MLFSITTSDALELVNTDLKEKEIPDYLSNPILHNQPTPQQPVSYSFWAKPVAGLNPQEITDVQPSKNLPITHNK